ncbi:MAG: winged helix-turn-helix domain-containing protein [Nanoarchaeota archaeon]
MSKKRSRLEIMKDILDVIRSKQGKMKPTHILYKSNLSHQMLEEYLGELKQKNFIVEHKTSEGKRYSVTERGMAFLDKYKAISEFTEGFGLS